ncbi:MAG: uracil-DNA glycosylase [Defluviicoccus sp.]|nr:uracil-DNA glycosylase [Defluviicoccus sp.]MDE0386858.1 uracil-DNA glycosylase [Defluviicoccus sp.]
MEPRQPPPDCDLCPRLGAFRDRHRAAEPGWHNAPVPSFGPVDARLLVVGLAPGLRGANRTGRPFTGDYAGDLLYATLLDFGFATGSYDRRIDDGLALVDCRVTNAVRCVPPENRPLGGEATACRRFLAGEIEAMPRLAVILALGTVAHASVVRAVGRRIADFKFAHGAMHALDGGTVLADSYHCSRYNLNTGRLTEAMFHAVIAIVRETLDRGSPASARMRATP